MSLADQLLAEIAGLEGRPYEEIGVPAFFIGEDSSRPSKTGDSPTGAAFAKLAGALASRKTDLKMGDIGQLMEVFAARDFPEFAPGNPIARVIDDATLAAAPTLPLPEGTSPALGDLVAGMSSPHAIRAVNIHATPSYRADEFRRQIAAYAEAYEPITPANFDAAVAGDWPHDRPGLMPLLFEGFRDNYDVMLPILEENGFTGWFMVPSIFPGMAAEEQRPFAAAHELEPALTEEYAGERMAITWAEARDIKARGHAFGCHSRHHVHLKPDTPLAELEDEIITAKAEMEAGLGTPVDIFCWLGAAALGVNPEADRLLREAGFRYLVSAFKIQKIQ